MYMPPNADQMRETGLASANTIPYPDLPAEAILALLVAEDSRFFLHGGIDLEAASYAIRHVFEKGILSAGSTISQQLVKNAFLSTERSVARKYEEAVYALKLEANFSKEEILSLYASMVEVAPGVYGLKEGARHYFDTPLQRLSVAQHAFLATVLRYPATAASRPLRAESIAQLRQDLAYVLQLTLTQQAFINSLRITEEDRKTGRPRLSALIRHQRNKEAGKDTKGDTQYSGWWVGQEEKAARTADELLLQLGIAQYPAPIDQ